MNKKLLLVFLLPVILGLPFVGRAFFVDDHYHMLMAKGLQEHPLRPYDFVADDAGLDNAGWGKGQPPRMVNPPAHHYFLALFDQLGGGRLWFVRLGCLFVAGFTAVFIFFLAQRFLIPPLMAAVMSVLTPAFLLSSYTLMIDSTMLMFFLGGLCAWIEGLHRRSWTLKLLAGFAMGLAILTKYTGGFVVILAFVYWFLHHKSKTANQKSASPSPSSSPLPLGKVPVCRKGYVTLCHSLSPLIYLLIPIVMLGLWSLWNIAVYGAPHLTESSKRVVQSFSLLHVISFLSFFSGGLVLPLAFAGLSWRKSRKMFGWVFGAAILFFLFLAGPLGGFSPGQAGLLSLLCAAGLFFFLALPGFLKSTHVSSDLFLVVWLGLGTLQMIGIMQWVAARYYLTMVVPVVFILIRSLQILCRHAPSKINQYQSIICLGMFVFGAGLCWADYSQSRTNRLIVKDVKEIGNWKLDIKNNKLSVGAGLVSACLEGKGQMQAGRPHVGYRKYYLGDSFTGSYLKDAGWKTGFADTDFQPGDLVLYRQVTMPPWWFRFDSNRFDVVKIYEYPAKFPLRVMDNAGAAGFYASAWGALPFTFSKSPLERFILLRVKSP